MAKFNEYKLRLRSINMNKIRSFHLMSSEYSIVIDRLAYAIQNMYIFHETVITIPEVVTIVLLKSASLGRILSASDNTVN